MSDAGWKVEKLKKLKYRKILNIRNRRNRGTKTVASSRMGLGSTW